LIILSKDGVIYTPISDTMPDKDQRRRLMPFVGKYVQVTGKVFEREGTHAIAIQDIKEMKEVHLITDAK
jgi:DNA/RNA endonuclease YhcR with UshA esterase domain